VNAFLTFAATQHTYTPEHLQGRPRVAQILEAAKAGHVPVRLVSSTSTSHRSFSVPIPEAVTLFALDLSEKNPLVELPHDASVIALLAVFSSGTHRGTSSCELALELARVFPIYIPVLVKSPAGSSESHLGMISDRRLLAYFSSFAHPSGSAVPPLPSVRPSASFHRYVSNSLGSLPLPSLNLYLEVVAVHSGNSVLDAMRLMSDLGVSSVAVLKECGNLLSAVSVTDIGQVCAEHVGSTVLVNLLVTIC
jgi:hypothetical protein